MTNSRACLGMLIGLLAGPGVVITEGASHAQAAPPAQVTPPTPRPLPPARDPDTPGLVRATELPDGAVPPADRDGNFVVGPTHAPAPETNRDLLGPNVMRDGMHDWVDANERMAAALAAKGYAYQFVFVRNAGHCDRAVKAQTLPAALEWIWR